MKGGFFLIRKILSIALVIVIAFTVSAPRAAATGVGGAALTVAEMAGVVGLIAGSLGIVFSGAGDMHDACEAFVNGLDPNSAAYLALASAVAQGSTIYIAGANAVNYLGGLVESVRSFFMPGDSVVVEGSGVSFTNMGQIYNGGWDPNPPSEVTRFNLTSAPVVFTDDSGNAIYSINCTLEDRGVSTNSQGVSYRGFRVVGSAAGADGVFHDYSNGWSAQIPPGTGFLYFGVYSGRICPFLVLNDSQTIPITGLLGPQYSLIVSVSGGGEEGIDIPVFQEAGALAPDLVGGVWDKLAEDAAAQNGNVTIDTNVGTYQGGATGYVDGDPNGVIAAPQAPSLGGAGSTRTETDTSTGTTTQTQTQTGAQAVPQADTANPAITDVQAQTTFNGAALTLTEIFPFCIPFDIYFMFKGLSVPREAPSFEIPLQFGSWLNFSHTFEFEQFEQYAQVLRSGELAVFVVGLAAATRKFIKW